MVYNKIIANNQTVLDISEDTVDSSKVLKGVSFHKNSGEKANGTIETYAGDTNVTENKILPTAGTYLNGDITVNVSGSTKVAPEYVSFRGYTGTTLDLSWLDTKNITNMSYMFAGCKLLTSLDLSKFDTSKVTSMSSMFESCSSLTSLDLSNFKTSNVTNMGFMFSGCKLLTSLDLSKFDTSKVTDMSGMFDCCSSLTSLDLSNFKTSNVTNMGFMFSGCSSLATIDLCNFEINNVTKFASMFNSVPTSCEILVKDETAKSWLNTNFPTMTNVKIKS